MQTPSSELAVSGTLLTRTCVMKSPLHTLFCACAGAHSSCKGSSYPAGAASIDACALRTYTHMIVYNVDLLQRLCTRLYFSASASTERKVHDRRLLARRISETSYILQHCTVVCFESTMHPVLDPSVPGASSNIPSQSKRTNMADVATHFD